MAGSAAAREADKAVVAGALEAINEGRLAALDGHPGLWETRQILPAARARFDDWRTLSRQQLAEDGAVFSFGAIGLTHRAPFGGVTPGGGRVALAGFSLDRVVAGTIVEHNDALAWPDVLRQLGAPGFAGWPSHAIGPLPPGAEGGPPAPAAEVKAVAARLLEGLAWGDAAAAIGHPGAVALAAEFAAIRAACPDLTLALVCQVAEGDLVGTRATLRGTQRAPLWGFAATGRTIAWDHYSVARVAGGAVVGARGSADWTAALIQLGLFPGFRG